MEEFKPEFAGKMNFYLSAVDDLLRHPDDGPSIGIILCQSRNEVVVEYALRDTSKPMGVARYRLSPALPDELRRELPTVEELAREFPLMSAVKLRVEIERALRDHLASRGVTLSRPVGVGRMLRELDRLGDAPPSTRPLLEALGAMNEAAHGLDVGPEAVERAIRTGTAFLDELGFAARSG